VLDQTGRDERHVLLQRSAADLERVIRKVRSASVQTEDSVALAFAELYGNDVRYDHQAKRWFVWTGNVWRPDETRVAYATMRALARDVSKGLDDSVQKNFGRSAFARGVEHHTKADHTLAVTSKRWDQDRYALGTPLGIVDLRTGKLKVAAREAFVTKQTAVGPSSAAHCPRWKTFLKEVTGGDADLTEMLHLWTGYLLTGDTKEETLVFLHGDGGNGKTVFINVISRLLGDYAAVAAMSTLMASKYDRHPEELAALAGARLVVASETAKGRRWDEARIKLLTGGNEIRARKMRQNSWTFRPEFKLTIEGNHLPQLSSVTDAIRRRFLIVPFKHKPAKVDRELERKLEPESPGILRWAIDGALQWQRCGLPRPKALVEATNSYLGGQDLVGNWLADLCIIRPGDRNVFESSSALYASWASYVRERGEDIGSQREFNDSLRAAGVSGPDQIRAINTKGFRGIKLKPQTNQVKVQTANSADVPVNATPTPMRETA
jgi:putative DNA primase/helicase